MRNRDSLLNRFAKRESEERARWEDFMVADGLKQISHQDAKEGSLLGKREREDEL